MSERRGRLRVAVPVHVPMPAALVETRLMTQVLVAELEPFGIASGGPKRQPGFPGYSGFVTVGPALQWRVAWGGPPASPGGGAGGAGGRRGPPPPAPRAVGGGPV